MILNFYSLNFTCESDIFLFYNQKSTFLEPRPLNHNIRTMRLLQHIIQKARTEPDLRVSERKGLDFGWVDLDQDFMVEVLHLLVVDQALKLYFGFEVRVGY